MSDENLSDAAFDRALMTAAFSLAAVKTWRAMSIAEAARAAGLSLDRARERCPDRNALLLRFGRLADQAALAKMPTEGTVRDRLFDLIMCRIDFLQGHRAGVLALFQALPADPATAVLLSCANRRSLAWMLNAACVSTGGIIGHLRVSGLLAVWLWTVRAWQKDENLDLSATMAALDKGLSRAEGLASWMHRPGHAPGRAADPGSEPKTEAPPAPPAEPAG